MGDSLQGKVSSGPDKRFAHTFQEMLLSLRANHDRYAIDIGPQASRREISLQECPRLRVDKKLAVLSEARPPEHTTWLPVFIGMEMFDAEYQVYDGQGSLVPVLYSQDRLDVTAAFEYYKSQEFHNFDPVELKQSPQPDMHAFMLLREVMPQAEQCGNLITRAQHDVVEFGPCLYVLERHLREKHVIELLRCGVTLGPNGRLQVGGGDDVEG